jgi:hypothetical protein
LSTRTSCRHRCSRLTRPSISRPLARLRRSTSPLAAATRYSWVRFSTWTVPLPPLPGQGRSGRPPLLDFSDTVWPLSARRPDR